MLHSRENPGSLKVDGEEAILVCRRLDDLPFAHMCELFHMVFKSHKTGGKSTGKRKKSSSAGFNPLRGEMVERNESEGFEREAVELVSDIRSIMKDLGEFFSTLTLLVVQMLIRVCLVDSQMKVASETPDFRSGAESLGSHLKFKKRNSGRLIATFLRSF